MFDVSFGELMVIAVVALIVIGPEKLPKVARTLGLLAGRMQRYVATVKSDIERELRTEELRKLHGDITQATGKLESDMAQEIRHAQDAASDTVEAAMHDQHKPGA